MPARRPHHGGFSTLLPLLAACVATAMMIRFLSPAAIVSSTVAHVRAPSRCLVQARASAGLGLSAMRAAAGSWRRRVHVRSTLAETKTTEAVAEKEQEYPPMPAADGIPSAMEALDRSSKGLLLLEHLNLNLLDPEVGMKFYGETMGCVRDPRRTPGKTPHHNCGAMCQFHTGSPDSEPDIANQGAQVWRGTVTVAYPPEEYPELLERLRALERSPGILADTQFRVTSDLSGASASSSSSSVEVTCPYGNRFRFRPATEEELRSLGGAYGRRPGTLGAKPLGIVEADVEVPRGVGKGVAEFYENVFGFSTSEDERGHVVWGGPGGKSQRINIVEVEDPPESTGEHLAIYISNFEETYTRCDERGSIWVNPRFTHLDNVTDLASARHYRQYRIRHLLDPQANENARKAGKKTGPGVEAEIEPLFVLEHEIRAVNHKSCPLVGETNTRALGIHPHVESQPYALPGAIEAVDHRLQLPLNWTEENPIDMVTVYAREVYPSRMRDNRHNLPVLLFLQGGPGYPSPRPPAPPSGWMKRALEEYRILLLDQRGTGLSSAITAQTLKKRLDDPDQAATYLKNFRQDSIVRDAEAFREALGADKLSILGQSFGGFCALTYLSLFPQSLESVYFTVGLAPVNTHVDDVYRATYKRVYERNRRYYNRYPMDVKRVHRIVRHLKENKVDMPSEGVLTPERFLQLGLGLGSKTGMESLHWLIEGAWVPDGTELSHEFLKNIESMQAFETNPIYFLLHEAIYADQEGPTGWSAQRMLEEVLPEMPEFDPNGAMTGEKPVYFTGEMVYPWMADEAYARLTPLKETAHKLAEEKSWREIYDSSKLRDTSVPCAALVSYEDLYVEREFSEKTAKLLGDKCQLWITNEHQHSGLRDDGYGVLSKLIAMSRSEDITPS